MQYYYNPEVKYLLVPDSEEKVKIFYDQNKNPLKMPMIGPRPPYYANPRYEQYYPVI